MLRFALLLPVFLTPAATAQDEIGVLTRAVSDFERVQLAPQPTLKDAIACVQSQAALLAALRTDQQYTAHFRKGLCELAAARLRESRAEYADAAADFQQTVAKWPAISASGDTVTAAVRVALALARLHAAEEPDLEDAARDLQTVLSRPNCPGTLLMPASECQRYVRLASDWLAWIRFRQGDLQRAAALLNATPESPWKHRVAGLLALDRDHYRAAIAELEKGLSAPAPAGFHGLLRPALDQPAARYELALARYLAADYDGALAAADLAVKGNPKNAQALFLRGSARERLGRTKEALADYELASRTAFANVNVPFESGYAHYYRGVALFRRKDFQRAESEFASALNFETADRAKRDVMAWRHMAAVAAGACESSSEQLARSLEKTSPFFPRDEARELLRACGPQAVSRARDVVLQLR